jgi:hypothetical protein
MNLYSKFLNFQISKIKVIKLLLIQNEALWKKSVVKDL